MQLPSLAFLAWTILFAPLVSTLGILLVGLRRPKFSHSIAIASMVTGFLASVYLFIRLLGSPGSVGSQGHGEHPFLEHAISWISLHGLQLEVGVAIDPLSVLMSLVVTGVGSVIFIYSAGYMSEEPSYSRYFAGLSLFAFSMLGIVLANNLVMLFMFWELVGVSSYLLIGFWYQKPSAAEAGRKAFMVNRVADFGFMIGILMLWTVSGATGQERTFNFAELADRIHELAAAQALPYAALSFAGAFLFCGVVGKSAQFPLHVWLPDAMEGPTPVSALIHAATMVAAGVYLIGRCFFLYADLPDLLTLIAYVGGFTAIFTASIAIVQNDIKRILAYSTLSQLGYMVMALGLGGYSAGIFHLATHAFFKALLFLGAGCMIHALHTNDIWEMGGLIKSMKVTSWTFLIGTAALCGIWPLSGFWSKDEILALAFHQDKFLWAIGSLTAMMTAFYMGRLCFAAIFGKPRGHGHSQEAPAVMTGPLVFLAILSVIGGFLGIPRFIHHPRAMHVEFDLGVALISTLCAVIGLGSAWRLYGKPSDLPVRLRASFRWLYSLLANKYYVDEIYAWLIRNVHDRIARLCALFERYVIMRFCVNGIAVTTRAAGSVLRMIQTGKVQTYALALFAGLLLILSWMMVGIHP
ncbi:MAG: NADH-quinone oxidoreductase subunit L [Candidatus Omnitrophica bacterium]|nr:NADH-quinone oxidoreductase subunit L [Candidatus Omnitrophota bacterium]